MFKHLLEEDVVGQTVEDIRVIVQTNPCLEASQHVLPVELQLIETLISYSSQLHQHTYLLLYQIPQSILSLLLVDHQPTVIDLSSYVL